mmetsp:Transcript_100551/g.123089  ORF Transcript_100551/g.123089 Transcript_100551/m.123089 type:complete len:167 (+) Transcript_100551:152-652(+)
MSESLTLNNIHNLVKHYCYLISNKDIPKELRNIIGHYIHYKISYNEGYKILTRGRCCAGFWSENGKEYIPGILAHKFKSNKKLMIKLLERDPKDGYYKIIQFPSSIDIMDCSHEYQNHQDDLNKYDVSECLYGYYSDDTELKYKEYSIFIKSYHDYLNKQNESPHE